MENVVNKTFESNQYILVWFKMQCSTTRSKVCGATLAIAHVEPNGIRGLELGGLLAIAKVLWQQHIPRFLEREQPWKQTKF